MPRCRSLLQRLPEGIHCPGLRDSSSVSFGKPV